MLWEQFEQEVMGETSPETKRCFAGVRSMVWRAVNAVNAKHPHGQIGLPEVSNVCGCVTCAGGMCAGGV